VAARFSDRRSLLAEITLDPPATSEDFAADPTLDEDYLILSTIHSAKGLEWDAVYVIHASDGNIPADMATKNSEQIEEERRLFYVALTRARRWLYVCCPLRYYQSPVGSLSDRYGVAQLTRFISSSVRSHFRCHSGRPLSDSAIPAAAPNGDKASGCAHATEIHVVLAGPPLAAS
jgi:DNA helicase-2/ATP-dependent DNA helicase PcrA